MHINILTDIPKPKPIAVTGDIIIFKNSELHTNVVAMIVVENGKYALLELPRGVIKTRRYRSISVLLEDYDVVRHIPSENVTLSENAK